METKNENGREEGRRRRKIVERGSDRMALITDRLHTLIPPAPPSSPTSYHINAGFEQQNTPKEVNIGNQIEPQLDKLKGSLEATKSQTIQSSSSSVHEIRPQPCELFTSKRLNSCIIASEGARIFCALIIAFLVVLSYVDYALFGRNLVRSESVVASRPLYILLLSDVTIVLARLYLENRGGGLDDDEDDENLAPVPDDHHGHNWTQALKFLERGLVIYQAVRGIFLDCSVYAVVVICGLSLV